MLAARTKHLKDCFAKGIGAAFKAQCGCFKGLCVYYTDNTSVETANKSKGPPLCCKGCAITFCLNALLSPIKTYKVNLPYMNCIEKLFA